MNRKKKTHLSKYLLCLMCAAFTISVLSVTASAAVQYMPDVTVEMTKPAYWSDKMPSPDTVLVEQEEIAALNDAILHSDSAYMNDLANWTEETFDGVSFAETLERAGMESAEYFFSQGAYYDQDGNKLDDWETALAQIYQPMIDNCVDPTATESMPIRYAICTTRTCIHSMPSYDPLFDASDDPDFDYQYQTMVRVGEPLIIKGNSADGQFYHVYSSCVSGWIPASDVAICADKNEWLAAWQFEPSETLVVYDDKISTEDSRAAPETANRKLPMGTCLKLATSSEWSGLISNRSAYNNYVVWMPVRQEDGSFISKLALISENRRVSEGFLPLTSANLAKVAMNQLGNAYGWGGMLDSDDCSGYVRDVYKCFGLELARNTTWQAAQPVRKFAMTAIDENMSSEEKDQIRAQKTALIQTLPVGSVLFFKGHEMLYLGSEGDKLYVISSVSSAMVDGVRTRIRGGVINTLDLQRPNGSTWLDNLHTAEIPYYYPDATDLSSADVTGIQDVTYSGKAVVPEITVTLGETKLRENAHYTVSVSDNKQAGTAAVTVQGIGNYAGTLEEHFQIYPKALDTSNVTLSTTNYTYNGSAKKPSVTVKDGTKTLVKDTDYTVTYAAGRINAGTYKVTVTGKGNYSGTVNKTFTIKAKAITPTVTLSKTAFVYNGKVQKPTVTVKDGTTKLTTASYTISWPSGCKVVGIYKPTVKLKGNYSGSKAVSYKINPKATTMSKVTAASKAFTAAWKKQATQTTGYQIQYSLSSTFASGNKSALITKNTTLSKKIIGLTAKKKYYVRVRTYKTVGNTKYYSAWSKALAVTTKV